MTRVSYDGVHKLRSPVEKSRLSRGFAPIAQGSHKLRIVANASAMSFSAWRAHGGSMSQQPQGMTHYAFTRHPHLRHCQLVLALHVFRRAADVRGRVFQTVA